MKKKFEKRFVVKKYIMATSVQEALSKERRFRPDEVFIDDEWMKKNPERLESVIGFQYFPDYEN